MCVDASGIMYSANIFADKFWRIDPTGGITDLGGEGNPWDRYTPGYRSYQARAWKVRFDPAGNLYLFTYMWGQKIDQTGASTRFTVPMVLNDVCFDTSGKSQAMDANTRTGTIRGGSPATEVLRSTRPCTSR